MPFIKKDERRKSMEKENNKRKIKGGVLAVILILAVCAAGFYAAVFEISNREPETLTTPATVAQKTTSAKYFGCNY